MTSTPPPSELPRESLDAMCRAALDHFGVAAQLNKMIQECGELLVAITQFQENRPMADLGVIEELADVTIMARQLSHVFGVGEVDEAVQKKLRRLKDRIRKERAEDGQETRIIGEAHGR